MNFEFFIAKRIIFGQSDKKNKHGQLVGSAALAIALGLAVMILSVAILTGFKREITDKLIGFSSHIRIIHLDNNQSFESEPITRNPWLEQKITDMGGVAHYYPFGIKAGIIHTENDLQGIVLKGIDSSYPKDFLQSFLVSGDLPDLADSLPGNGVLISHALGKLLKLRPGDRIPTYFIQMPPAVRPFVVTGLYHTGLEEFDLRYVFCDIRHIQKINGWTRDQITGYEILLTDDRYSEAVEENLSDLTMSMLVEGTGSLDVQSVREFAPGFFDFLKLTDTNVWVILALMILVSGFNMISGLLILILNRTNMIGILKALGASNASLRKVFLIQAAYIIGVGLLIGNLLGITLAVLQDTYQIISLDPQSYFVDAVPINLNPAHLVLLNAGTLLITLIMLLIPSRIISGISPAKTIKFD